MTDLKCLKYSVAAIKSSLSFNLPLPLCKKRHIEDDDMFEYNSLSATYQLSHLGLVTSSGVHLREEKDMEVVQKK